MNTTETAAASGESPAQKPRSTALRWLLALLLAAGSLSAFLYYRGHYGNRPAGEAVADAIVRFHALGPLGPLVFVLVYALAAVCFVPGTLLTLSAGALFGPWWGTLYVTLGANLAAMISFGLARTLLGDWARERAGGRLKKLQDGIAANGWRFVAFTRLTPVFPFTLLNYILGLTPIRFRTATLTSAVCMLPATLAYVYLGYATSRALGGGDSLGRKITLLLGGLAFIGVLALLSVWLRKSSRLQEEKTA